MLGESDIEVAENGVKCGRCCDSSLSSDNSAAIQVPKEIVILVESIESLDFCKIKEVVLKMEYIEDVLAESEPIQIERYYTEMNFSGIIKVGDVTPQIMDDVLAHPVLITVFDCTATPGPALSLLPHQRDDKDRKKKNSLSSVSSKTYNSQVLQEKYWQKIGVCNLDIGDLVMGKKKLKETLVVEPDKKVPLQERKSWLKLPKIGISACVSCDFVPDHLLKSTNAIGVTVESVFNLPSSFRDGSICKAKIPIPKYGDVQNYLVFPNGAIKVRDSDLRRKWLTLLHIEGGAGRSKQTISGDVCDILNTLPKKTCLEKQIVTIKEVIEWNTWRKCLLLKHDNNYIYSKLIKHRVWPIEVQLVNKMPPPKVLKLEKKNKGTSATATTVPSHSISENQEHYIAYLNLSALLYPGVTKTRVAAQLYYYSQFDLKNKFGTETESSQVGASISNSKSKPGTDASKISAKDTEEKDLKDSKEFLGEPVVNDEGMPTFIIVEVEVHKPFVQKKEPEFMQEQLNSYLCIKERLIKKESNVAVAKKKFATTLMSMTTSLINEYQKFCKMCKANEQEIGDLEKEFLDYLYRQDKIQKIKSSLEDDVFNLIIERFGAVNYQERIPEIYVSLVNFMYKITNTIETQNEASMPYPNAKNLQLFAEEAFEEGEYELSKKYLLMKLTLEPHNANFWLDYATFLIKVDEHEEAVEAIREALSIDPDHFMGLLLYGLLMSRAENLKIAELAFEVLLSKHPNFVEGWVSLRMLYQALYNAEGEIVAGQSAKKLEYIQKNLMLGRITSEKDVHHTSLEDHYNKIPDPDSCNESIKCEPLSWTATLCPPDNGHLKTAVLLLKLGIHEYASMALTLAISNQDCRHSPYESYYQAVNLYNQEKYVEAICILDSFARHYGKDCYVWSLMGHCYYKLGRHEKAIPCYEYVMECYNRPDDIHLIYLRMGYYFLKVKKLGCAKQIFLTACKYSATPKLWKGIGIACLGLCELDDAEIAFSEANYLDNRDPEIWAYLAQTNALMNRHVMFQHCYAEAKKRDLSNQKLIEEIESCADFNQLEMDL